MATPSNTGKRPASAAPQQPAAATRASLQPSAATATPTPVRTAKPAPTEVAFVFDRSNYMWMIAGVALILLGFVLISGGKSSDPAVFNADELYSIRRVTVAPLVMLLGFGLEVYAIMKRPKGADLAHRADDAAALQKP